MTTFPTIKKNFLEEVGFLIISVVEFLLILIYSIDISFLYLYKSTNGNVFLMLRSPNVSELHYEYTFVLKYQKNENKNLTNNRDIS